MTTVTVSYAKTYLSQLVEAIESGNETEILIINGKPAARLVTVASKSEGRRLGQLAGKYPSMSLEDFNADDEEIARLFGIDPEP